MGHSRASKREHHEAIVGVAASRFREDGIDRVGVADLMHDAGLTHGGFYRHFESRDQLVAEAVERASVPFACSKMRTTRLRRRAPRGTRRA